jgi:hypothetical protein
LKPAVLSSAFFRLIVDALVIQQPSIFNAPWQPISGVYFIVLQHARRRIRPAS